MSVVEDSDYALLFNGVQLSLGSMQMWKRFLSEESGATMVEYGLMVALIAIVAIVAVRFLGDEVSETFTNIGNELSSANAGP